MSEKTKILQFYGASDDNFCYAVNGKSYDEIGCFEAKPFAVIKSESTGEGMIITGNYSLNQTCTWSIGVSQLEEDAPLPDWLIQFTAEGYTTKCHVEVPIDATVELKAEPF